MFSKLVFLLSMACIASATTSSTPATSTEVPVTIVTKPNPIASSKPEVEDILIKSICDAEDPASVIEKTDECIVDPVMKEGISKCRVVSYGSSVAKEASSRFCAGSLDARAEMDDLFDSCLRNQGLNQEAIQVEFVANCGFCSNIELANKTEECFSDGEVKNNWVDCRQEVYATRDAMIAAEKYCQGNKLERLSMDRLFDACLMSKDVSQEAFEAALTNC